jgi:hypothetical protein
LERSRLRAWRSHCIPPQSEASPLKLPPLKRPPPARPQKWKGKLDDARKAGDALAAAEAGDMVVLYDSLQVGAGLDKHARGTGSPSCVRPTQCCS